MIIARHVRRDGTVLVRLDTGEWLPEAEAEMPEPDDPEDE